MSRLAAAFLVFAGLLLAPAIPAGAAPPTGAEDIQKGIYGSLAVPLGELEGEPPPDDPWRRWLHGLTIGAAFNTPLSLKAAESGSGTQGALTPNSPNFEQTIRYNPIGAWFGMITFYEYILPSLRAPWNPDFTYVFGYDDWRPYTFSLVYANYSGNRLSPGPGQSISHFDQGIISAGFKFPFPEQLLPYFLIDPEGAIGFTFNYNVIPRYTKEGTSALGSWQQFLTLNTRFTIWGWVYGFFTFYVWPAGGQQPWDPDYTYGFGYYDWHPGTIGLQYSNYTGNRYPGRKVGKNTGQFEDGSVTLSWSWTW